MALSWLLALGPRSLALPELPYDTHQRQVWEGKQAAWEQEAVFLSAQKEHQGFWGHLSHPRLAPQADTQGKSPLQMVLQRS